MTGDTRWTIFAMSVTTAVVALDWFSTPSLVLALILGPLVAAGASRPTPTVVTSVYALGWGLALALREPLWWGDQTLRLCLLLAGTVVVSVLKVSQARREEIARHVEAAADAAQRAVLRPLPPFVDRVALAARSVSASEQALVGGDLYEAVGTPFGARIVLGDVRGRGLDAISLASTVLGAFRERAYSVPSLSGLARSLNDAVERHGSHEDFVTAVLVEIRDLRLSIVNCGHPSPLSVSHGGVRWLDPPRRSLPLGVDCRPLPCTFGRLDLGERILLFTDGLTEARDIRGSALDVETEAGRVLPVGALDDALDRLVERLLAHVGGELHDDVALVGIEALDAP